PTHIYTLSLHDALRSLCDAADAGNKVAIDIIDKSAVLVSRAVAVVTNTLDVERVVFGGPFWGRLADRYLARIPDLLIENSAARRDRKSTRLNSSHDQI